MKNTETKFTPRIARAPWTWEKDKPLLAADGQLVNGVSRTNEQLANHRAMLAAAPKMFESETKFVQLVNNLAVALTPEQIAEATNDLVAHCQQARAVLDLAGGGR